MRPIVLMLCLALGGCVTADANVAADVTGSTPAAATAAAPSADAREAQASDNHADKHEDEWWKEPGVTREKVSALCWMRYEKGRKDLPLEQRADLVNACVEKELKEHPLH